MLTVILRPITLEVYKRITHHKQRVLFFRQPPRRAYDRILCFTPDPTPTLCLELLPGETLELPLRELHSKVFRHSGMIQHEWDSYFAGKSHGTAVLINHFAVLPSNYRINPCDRWNLKRPPENFCYITTARVPLGRPDVIDAPTPAGLLL